MNEVQGSQPVVQQQNTSNIPTNNHINIWMIISIILIIAFIGLGAYMLSKNNSVFPTTSISVKPSITQTPISQTPIQPTLVSTLTPTIFTNSTKKVSAGIKTQSFSPYSITIPSGWTDNHRTDSSINFDGLTLTKGQYSLAINQGGMGGGYCIFLDETPQPMSQVFNSFVAINGTTSQFRRGTTDNKNFTICELKTNGYGFPTSFGSIIYSTPQPADQTILSEMDGMVASLTK